MVCEGVRPRRGRSRRTTACGERRRRRMETATMKVPFRRAFVPVDHSTSIPLNTQIVLQFEEALRAGMLSEGDQLPSELDLGKGFQVSRTTLRRAMARLEERGAILRERGRGKGTTVVHAEPITRSPGTTTTLYEMIAASSRLPITTLLTYEHHLVDETFSVTSGFSVGTRVIHILRHRSANAEPIAVLENWILEDHVTFAPERLGMESMEMLLQEGGVRQRRVLFEYRATVAGDHAEFLGVSADTPVIDEIRHVHDNEGQYEYSHHVSHPENERVRGAITP
ncbi:MAG: GntR family transcriptional regulator [Brachybacterium tyrofermentans]